MEPSGCFVSVAPLLAFMLTTSSGDQVGLREKPASQPGMRPGMVFS